MGPDNPLACPGQAIKEKPPVCPRCGADIPKGKLATLCFDCMEALYLDRTRQRESEALVKEPDPWMHLCRARGDHARHLVLRCEPEYCYCGSRTQGPRNKWLRQRLSQLPELGVCPSCRDVLGVIKKAARVMAVEGGTS